MRDNILKWVFECDDTGTSSKAMAAFFAGLSKRPRMSTPCDPADFNRCLKFLKWVPEAKDRLHEMKSLSSQWSNLVDHWDEIESCFLEEVGFDWSKGRHLHATKTYNLMKSVFSD